MRISLSPSYSTGLDQIYFRGYYLDTPETSDIINYVGVRRNEILVLKSDELC